MRFSVGWRVEEDNRFLKEIISRKSDIYEVYFSWGNFPSGRNDQTRALGLTPWEAQTCQTVALSAFAGAGIPVNILFNANCYGARSQSRAFFNEIGTALDYIAGRCRLVSVTTTSFLAAKFIKQNFPGLDVRASVNMGIGTTHAMEYAAEYFDSFYVQREKNRDFTALRTLRTWCDKNGKEMYLLANSGCLNDCSAHTFHDNLVAHEQEIAVMDNGYAFFGLCREFLNKPENHSGFLTHTNFIRPEDIHLYEDLVPAVKLATRVHKNPVQILRAYIDNGHFSGNLPTLLEPDHAGVLYPYVVENGKIKAKIENNTILYENAEEAFIRLEE